MAETLTPQESDAELAQVLALQTAFKHTNMTRIGCAIIKAATGNGGFVWPDDPQLVSVTKSLAGDDKNCVGSAWRWLGKLDILSRTNEHRKSVAKASKGREVAKWRVQNWRLAEVFVKRNDAVYAPPQQELFG